MSLWIRNTDITVHPHNTLLFVDANEHWFRLVEQHCTKHPTPTATLHVVGPSLKHHNHRNSQINRYFNHTYLTLPTWSSRLRNKVCVFVRFEVMSTGRLTGWHACSKCPLSLIEVCLWLIRTLGMQQSISCPHHAWCLLCIYCRRVVILRIWIALEAAAMSTIQNSEWICSYGQVKMTKSECDEVP